MKIVSIPDSDGVSISLPDYYTPISFGTDISINTLLSDQSFEITGPIGYYKLTTNGNPYTGTLSTNRTSDPIGSTFFVDFNFTDAASPSFILGAGFSEFIGTLTIGNNMLLCYKTASSTYSIYKIG